MEIIIEEVNRGHKLIGRHKLDKDTVLIGRGYGNDIILSDPHVCPEHLRIEFDGDHWRIFDNNSINGSFIGNSKIKADQHILSSGDVISFGKSQIRVMFVDQPVAETVPFSVFESFVDFTRNPLVLIANLLIFGLVTGYVTFLGQPKEVTLAQQILPAVKFLMLFSVWPLMVALVSHLTKHDARTLNQLGVTFALFNLMWLSDIFERMVAFNFSSSIPIAVIASVLPIVLTYTLFWLNCYIGFHMTKRRRTVISASLVLLFFGGGWLVNLTNQPDFRATPKYNSVIMTPGFLIAPPSSTEAFVEDSNALFDKARKAAEKDKN